jgi:hypothetical protein
MRSNLWFSAAVLVLCAFVPAMGFLDPGDPAVKTFSDTQDDGFSRVTGETLVNRGLSGSIRCKTSQEPVVLKFDLSSLAGQTITDAELHVCASSASLLYAADVCTICVPWNEGVTSGGFNNGSPGDPCWDWRHIPVNMSSPAATDYWTIPGSDMTYATYGNNGSLASFAHPADQGFTTYTATTPAGTSTFYRIKVDPEVIHALILDQYGLTLSDTRGYLGQNNTVYTRDQWGGSVAPKLLIKGGLTDTTAPGPVTGFSAVAGNWNGQALLSWVAPTDSGPKGKAFGYDVRYSTAAITQANFTAATQVDRWRIPRPQTPGTSQQMLVEGLTAGSTYYFAMRAYDQAGNADAVVTASLALPAVQTVTPLAAGGFTVPAPASSIPSVPGVLQYWAASEYTKVNPVTGNRWADGYTGTGGDAYKKGNPVWDAVNSTVLLKAARNEVVGFQLILQKLVNLTGVSVSVSDLTNAATTPTATIPASPNVEKFLCFYLPSGGTYYPDACIPLAGPFATTFAVPNTTNNVIASQTNQSVWVDIYVPKTVPAGTYTGTISVTAAQLGSPLTIPVRLIVRNWQVPDQVSFIVDLNGYHTPWSWGQAAADVATTKLSYFQLGHKHRENINTVPNSHTLNSDFSARVDGDRIPTLTGSGASIAVSSWTSFDNYWAKFLDGTAFTAAQGYNGPGAGVGVPAFYTPFYESWPLSSYFWYDYNGLGGAYWYTLCPGPSLPVAFLQTAPAPASAYPVQYETGVKNIIKAFAEHAQAKGWTKTYMQFYLNNKYSWGNATNPHSQFWNLDEPTEGDCMMALGYFNKIFRQGVTSATAPDVKWHYRIDISDKTGLNRGTMNGQVNLWDCSFVDTYHGLMPSRKLNWPDEQWWYYGGGTDPTGSELANTKRFLQVWCWGVDGALPYWDSYQTSWTSAAQLSVVYSGQSIPGYSSYNGAIASLRMKQMRRGQHDIEYLAYLAGSPGWNRSAAARALAQRYADSGGNSYTAMNELNLFQMREDVAASIPVLDGDTNNDGHVDVTDLLTLVYAFGTFVGDAAYDPSADFNSDGAVDVYDLLTLVYSFGV